MDRNTTIAFILIGGILVLWLYMNSPTPEERTLRETDTTTTVEKPPKPVEQAAEAKEDPINLGEFFTASKEDGEIITIENELVLVELSTKGGNFNKFFLKKFNNWYSTEAEEYQDVYNTKVQLINYSLSRAYNLSFITTDGKKVNTESLLFKPSLNQARYSIAGNDSLVLDFTYESAGNSSIVKRFIFFGNKYIIKSDIMLNGMNKIISNNMYDIVWEGGVRFVEQNSVDEATYANSSVYYGDEQVIVDASDNETITEDFNGKIDWLAVRNKYFAAMIIPQNPASVDGAYLEGSRKNYPNNGVREFYDARIKVPFKGTDSESSSFYLFIGPVDYDLLSEYGRNLEAVVDFGGFFGLKIIVRPIAEYILLPLFTFLHTFIPNFGFVIIIFALIIKIVVYPLTKQSYQSMKKMQLLQPKMAEIKEKYKDDPPKMNKETMKLYSTYGVNPAGGCFPLLLQMPIFIALWGMFQIAIELRQAPFIWWIHDLSRPDVIANLPFKIPMFGIDQISGLALLMGITTFVQQKMTMKDPKQQMLVYIMPIMLTIMFMSFPSGLNLYYFMFNLFSIAQQYYINHTHTDMVLEPVKNPKKKSGFMTRLMEAAEQQQKKQTGKKR